MNYTIRVCSSPVCTSNLSNDIFFELKKLTRDNDSIQIEKRGCMSLCHLAPNVEIVNNDTGESTIKSRVSILELSVLLKELI